METEKFLIGCDPCSDNKSKSNFVIFMKKGDSFEIYKRGKLYKYRWINKLIFMWEIFKLSLKYSTVKIYEEW